MDAFIGEIRAFANTYYPEGWLPCNGDRISLQQYQALFSIIGSFYGPTDGQTYFTLPDLRGTALVCAGTNPQSSFGLSLGQTSGTETVALSGSQLPIHRHTMNGAVGTDNNQLTTEAGSDGNSFLSNVFYKPTGATSNVSANGYIAQSVTPVILNSNSIAPTGGNTQSTSVPHNNMSPYLAINYYICATDGYYPERP